MLVNLIVLLIGLIVLYRYHKSEVEAGRSGLPGLQRILQHVESNVGMPIAPVSGKGGQTTPSSSTPALSMPSLETNSGDKAQGNPAWVPQSSQQPKFSSNKVLLSERNKNLNTMQAGPAAGAPDPANPMAHYPTYRPLLMKPDEKTAKSIADDKTNKDESEKGSDENKDKKKKKSKLKVRLSKSEVSGGA